ncbi:hypothetical protein [Paraburkholderia sp. J11-2]|nr:hypothetical protein [Paraburkholderia sp. J11-2]
MGINWQGMWDLVGFPFAVVAVIAVSGVWICLGVKKLTHGKH